MNNLLNNILTINKVTCVKCGNSLESSRLIPVGGVSFGFIAQIVCDKCKTENTLAISKAGIGVNNLVSDLTISELRKFGKGEKKVNFKDVVKLHRELKKDSICNLLQKKEKKVKKIIRD